MYRRPRAACRKKERRSWDQEGREEQSERRARLLLWGNRKEARLQEEGSCESKEVWPPSVLRVAGPVGAFPILCPGLLGLLPEDC